MWSSSRSQLTAKLALWGLSRQELPVSVCSRQGVKLIAAMTPALSILNRYVDHIHHRSWFSCSSTACMLCNLQKRLTILALLGRCSWQSFECVSFAATAMVKIGDRCWEMAKAHCGDWLRPFAELLLAAPPAEHFQVRSGIDPALRISGTKQWPWPHL
jgi:hypothetical protein